MRVPNQGEFHVKRPVYFFPILIGDPESQIAEVAKHSRLVSDIDAEYRKARYIQFHGALRIKASA